MHSQFTCSYSLQMTKIIFLPQDGVGGEKWKVQLIHQQQSESKSKMEWKVQLSQQQQESESRPELIPTRLPLSNNTKAAREGKQPINIEKLLAPQSNAPRVINDLT